MIKRDTGEGFAPEVPDGPGGAQMTGTVGLFVSGAGAGVIAGGTSCAAAQLGLLIGAVSGRRRAAASVGAFLTGKLASHAVLGAVLGTVGAAVQPSPRVRAVLLAAAALLIVLFALDLLGLRSAGRLLRRTGGAGRAEQVGRTDRAEWAGPAGRADPAEHADRADRADPADRAGGEPSRAPCAPAREPLVSDVTEGPESSRDTGRALLRPAVLGASTVLVPCGLTLSAELLAVTSRSVAGGAAVMTGFVIGTAPFFGLLGVTLGRGMSILRGLPTALIGVGLIGVAIWTLLSGLRLGGWLPPDDVASTDRRFVQVDAGGTQVITVWALDRGYRPARVSARPGVRTVLVLRTRRTTGCTRAFVIPARGVERILPVDGSARIDLGTPTAGRLRFVCASGHYPGRIDFRPAGASRRPAVALRRPAWPAPPRSGPGCVPCR